LKEAEVSGEGYAGDGDDGEGGGFGGDDGERDGPPGDGVVGEEVGLEGGFGGAAAVAFAEAESEERDADEIDRYEREVEGMEAGWCGGVDAGYDNGLGARLWRRLWEARSVMAIFVAVDAGGTKTQCWVADESRVLGRAVGPTVKIMAVGADAAAERLGVVVREAAGSAGVALKDVVRTCMGLAGTSGEGVKVWAEATLRELVGGEVIVCGDEEIALDAAFEGGPGVLVIAGTGSNVAGRCADGTVVTAGGWGPVIGDEGSGSWIGLEAIRAGLRAHDRNVSTCLLREIEKFWGLKDMGELIARANERTRPDFAELTAVVAHCAEDGDGLAASVLERAGEELAEQVSLVMSKMRAAGCAAEDAAQVAFTGSVLEKIPRVLRSMEEHLRGVQVRQAAVEPLEGALWRAKGEQGLGIRD
jgi:glucosamine kinase